MWNLLWARAPYFHLFLYDCNLGHHPSHAFVSSAQLFLQQMQLFHSQGFAYGLLKHYCSFLLVNVGIRPRKALFRVFLELEVELEVEGQLSKMGSYFQIASKCLQKLAYFCLWSGFSAFFIGHLELSRLGCLGYRFRLIKKLLGSPPLNPSSGSSRSSY